MIVKENIRIEIFINPYNFKSISSMPQIRNGYNIFSVREHCQSRQRRYQLHDAAPELI